MPGNKVDKDVLLDMTKYCSITGTMKQHISPCNRYIMGHPLPRSFRHICQRLWDLGEETTLHKGWQSGCLCC